MTIRVSDIRQTTQVCIVEWLVVRFVIDVFDSTVLEGFRRLGEFTEHLAKVLSLLTCDLCGLESVLVRCEIVGTYSGQRGDFFAKRLKHRSTFVQRQFLVLVLVEFIKDRSNLAEILGRKRVLFPDLSGHLLPFVIITLN